MNSSKWKNPGEWIRHMLDMRVESKERDLEHLVPVKTGGSLGEIYVSPETAAELEKSA
jgi:hypothetical protein